MWKKRSGDPFATEELWRARQGGEEANRYNDRTGRKPEKEGKRMNVKVLIAMSGGVDSSVAALLMRGAGYECIGCTMLLRDPGAGERSACGSGADIEDARRVADTLGIEHIVLDLRREFASTVIDPFISAYKAGYTPNPCIICNRFMKFGRLLSAAEEMGCAKLVTGHYARIGKVGERYVLRRGTDPGKDQSYVLAYLRPEQLARVLFPLGTYSKDEIRKMAEEAGLCTARKKDSQDICFVPGGDYIRFLQEYTGEALVPGDFVGTDGQVLGRHRGLPAYTVGQHKKLGIVSEQPLYVQKLCPRENTVVLGRNEDLYARTFFLEDFHLSGPLEHAERFRAEAKIRYRQDAAPAEVFPLPDGRCRVVFDTPVRAITPGQTGVLYDGDTVVGCGRVCGGDLSPQR